MGSLNEEAHVVAAAERSCGDRIFSVAVCPCVIQPSLLTYDVIRVNGRAYDQHVLRSYDGNSIPDTAMDVATLSKDHVRHEYQAWRSWPDKWGFLTREYTRMNRRLRGQAVSPDPEDRFFYADCDRTPLPESEEDEDSDGSRQPNPLDQSGSARSSGVQLKRASAYSNLPAIANGSSRPRRSPSVTPADDVLIASHDLTCGASGAGGPRKSGGRKLPSISAEAVQSAPPAGFARTTAALIGWKQNNTLERFGRAPNARGHKGILKQFNWPMQGIM